MKLIIMLLLVLLLPVKGKSQKIIYDLAYESGDKVFVVKYKSSNRISFSNAMNPSLSPDGLFLAVDKVIKKGHDIVERSISIIDLNTKKEIKLCPDTSKYFNPTWSPNNQYIAFNTYHSGNFTIGLIKKDNSGFKVNKYNSSKEYCTIAWTSDGKYIVSHNWEMIFKFDLNLNPIDSLPMFPMADEILTIGSDTKFIFTPDNKFIIFNCTIDEASDFIKGPVDGIYSYEIQTKKIKRITPKGLHTACPVFETDSTIIFSALSQKGYNIYRSDIDGKKLTLIHANGEYPSVRRYR